MIAAVPVLFLFAGAAPVSTEAAVLEEINLLRSSPAKYARHLEPYLRWFDGATLREPGAMAMQTNEGPEAVKQAIQALRAAAPVKRLSALAPLAESARALADAQGPSGGFGHVRPTSQQLSDWRLRGWAQNITYGPHEARRVVIEQLIDDGVADRGHRRNLLDPRFDRAGVACAPHRVYGQVCVINLGAAAPSNALPK